MSAAPIPPNSSPMIEAVLFGLDGVLTDTASLHEAAWQLVFDELFARRPAAGPFTHSDYQRHAADLRRPGGLKRVLGSYGIHLPDEARGDPPSPETLATLSGRKEEHYVRLLRDRGTHAFASSTTLLRALRGQGLATAVVTSSPYCSQVLDMAGLSQMLDIQVDGLDLARLKFATQARPRRC